MSVGTSEALEYSTDTYLLVTTTSEYASAPIVLPKNPPSDTLQLWRVESTGEERKVNYLSTLVKHTQAVNVVRFSPKGMTSVRATLDNALTWCR